MALVRLGAYALTRLANSEVTAQIWENMQQNCGIDSALTVYPDLNVSGPPYTA